MPTRAVWREILGAGGYDCLPKPFRSDEVYRLVSLAWRSWKDQSDRGTRAYPRIRDEPVARG